MQAPFDVDDQAFRGDHGVSNNGVLAVLLLAMVVGYFTCVKPMTDQVSSMRRSVACLQNRVAKLVKEADAAGEGGGLLVELARQRESAVEAAAALNEIESLNRRLAGQTRQIALLATSDDLAQRTLQRIVEHRELLGAAESALTDATLLEQQLVAAERQIASATSAAQRMQTLCSEMAAARSMIDEAQAASEELEKLQTRLVVVGRQTPTATVAIDRLQAITGKLAASDPQSQLAEGRLARLVSLQARLVSQPDQTSRAVEALDVLTDLRGEVINAEGEFDNLRKVLLEVALMRPAVDRAVATLNPIRELATLRYLDADQLQVAARALRATTDAPITK